MLNSTIPLQKKKEGMLLIISSPSGAGKTTLSRRLRERFPELQFSVSYTTRSPREKEISGVDYHFVNEQLFDLMIKNQEFAEWAHVFGHRYGTTVSSVRTVLDLGQDVLFDVDYQGAESLYKQFPHESCLIYILPPSIESLAARLRARGTETEERIQKRLQKAMEEISHYRSYQYLVVNDRVEQAELELTAIYQYERNCRMVTGFDAQSVEQERQKQLVQDYMQWKRADFAEYLLQSKMA